MTHVLLLIWLLVNLWNIANGYLVLVEDSGNRATAVMQIVASLFLMPIGIWWAITQLT